MWPLATSSVATGYCVLQDTLYWSDWEARSILRVDKLLRRAGTDGDYGVTSAVVQLYSPMDIHIYHELKQPTADSELLHVVLFSQFSLVRS